MHLPAMLPMSAVRAAGGTYTYMYIQYVCVSNSIALQAMNKTLSVGVSIAKMLSRNGLAMFSLEWNVNKIICGLHEINQ